MLRRVINTGTVGIFDDFSCIIRALKYVFKAKEGPSCQISGFCLSPAA
ncbi:MAG: hypothetical protein ACJARO_000631 [Bacteriovoracaceae bacterium]|jgi:hypothetical protein